MTEMVYHKPLESFQTISNVDKKPQIIPILEQGRPLLEKLNKGINY
jgi:hypothetical protein